MKLTPADRAAAALIWKPNEVFRVHYENGYPQAIMLGKTVVIHLIEKDIQTMACVEPLVELLNDGIWRLQELRVLAERGS